MGSGDIGGLMPGCYAAFHKQLGDLVLLEPALSKLRDHHGAPVRLLTRNGHAGLASLMPGVEVVRGLPLSPASALYCYDPLNKSALRSLLAPAAARRLIVPERRELAWFHPLLFPSVTNPELGDDYVAEFFWRNTPVPSRDGFRPPVLARPPEEWAPAERPPEGYVLLNPTAGWRKKMWTVEGWTHVLQVVGPAPVVLTSATADWQVAHVREIAQASGGTVLSTSLQQFLWICANASLVLTVDGSASHLAAAFGVPCFTLFGPTSRSNWHRPNPRHVAFQPASGSDGRLRLRRLPADPVVQAVRGFLQSLS